MFLSCFCINYHHVNLKLWITCNINSVGVFVIYKIKTVIAVLGYNFVHHENFFFFFLWLWNHSKKIIFNEDFVIAFTQHCLEIRYIDVFGFLIIIHMNAKERIYLKIKYHSFFRHFDVFVIVMAVDCSCC